MCIFTYCTSYCAISANKIIGWSPCPDGRRLREITEEDVRDYSVDSTSRLVENAQGPLKNARRVQYHPAHHERVRQHGQ
jgi:hypothetical protein